MADRQQTIHIVGAGLAGSECALQLASMGFQVVLYEMRGQTMTPAHKTNGLAELVCSNSFGTMADVSAPGQLKWEAEHFGSYILKAAKLAQVPAGQALGVDRDIFSRQITAWVSEHPNIRLERTLVSSLTDLPRPAVIATGPLTHSPLCEDLQAHFGTEYLYFFDAIAPIIAADTIDTQIAWKADRWDKGTPDYYNCPMTRDEYFTFITEIKNARKIEPKEFEKTEYFEGCMPIEAMLERGDLTPVFGPMKPVGLRDPRTGIRPFAVVQLRQENKEATAYNMVGFQTKMAYPEQSRIFRMIPGLQNAEFLKLGSVHRNLFIHTPMVLNTDLSSKKDPNLYFAGQITGVEGYFESTCIGLLVARFIRQKQRDLPFTPPPRASALGSLLNAITESDKKHFQPTNINFGLFPNITDVRDKKLKRETMITRAKEAIRSS